MDVTSFIAPIGLFAIAIVFRTGKANILLKGCNTASSEEKTKTDEKAFAKFISKLFFVLGLIQLVPSIATSIEFKNLKLILLLTTIIRTIVLVIGIIYMNRGKRFQKKI